MIGRYIKAQFAKFGRKYSYDTQYMQDLVDDDLKGGIKLVMATGFTRHTFGLPPAPFYAAKITATRLTDCGSCLRLSIDMAVEAGVPLAAIRQLLTENAAAPTEMTLAAHYARAVIENDPALPDLIEACASRWGRRGVAGLAAAVTSGQFFPTIKRGMGHGNACTPVMKWLADQESRVLVTADG